MKPEPKAPNEFSALLLPDSEVGYISGEFGKILLQEIHVDRITILYNIFRIKKDIPITFSWKPGMPQVHAALKTGNHYYINGLRNTYLDEGEFNIVHASSIDGTHFLEGGREYQNIHIIYSRKLLDRLLPLFPTLEKWFASDMAQPKLLFKRNPFLTTEQRNIIRNILSCSRFDNSRVSYLEIMAEQFLLLSMIPIDQPIIRAKPLSRKHIELIHESRRLLDTNFGKLSSIDAIAKELDISESKLKSGFKIVFGVNISEYRIQTRMQAAQKLL